MTFNAAETNQLLLAESGEAARLPASVKQKLASLDINNARGVARNLRTLATMERRRVPTFQDGNVISPAADERRPGN